jgi:hypothetical protein
MREAAEALFLQAAAKSRKEKELSSSRLTPSLSPEGLERGDVPEINRAGSLILDVHRGNSEPPIPIPPLVGLRDLRAMSFPFCVVSRTPQIENEDDHRARRGPFLIVLVVVVVLGLLAARKSTTTTRTRTITREDAGHS